MSSRHLATLQNLLNSKRSANDPELKTTLAGLRLEITQRLKGDCFASVDFFSSSIRALSRLRGTANARVRVNSLCEIGFFLASQGYAAEAFPAIHELSALAKRTRDRTSIRRADLLAGLVNADVGNVAEAVICYTRSWEIACEIGHVGGQAGTLVNLGGALIYGALYREAIQCLELAISLSRSAAEEDESKGFGSPPAEMERCALTNLAQCYLYLQDFHRGFDSISRCLGQSPAPVDTFTALSRVVREFTYVQLALELGMIEEARRHTIVCDNYARACGRRGPQLAAICRGLCEVYGGDTYRGLEILESTLRIRDALGTVRTPLILPLIRACEAAERPELALKYMNQMLEEIKSTRERNFSALLSAAAERDGPPLSVIDGDDLHALKLAESRLRARIAENKAVNARIEILERLAITADLREEQSGEHGYRVGKLSALLAEELGWTKDVRFALELAARLHDIGKIGVPDRILLTSQHLRDAERQMMSVHTSIGAELLARSDIPQLRMAEEIARYHHEWWDGTGYLAKLAGKRIPIHARIVALADVFDALTHGRPYAPAWPIERALEEIQTRRGTQFDPELTDRFIELVCRLQKEHADLDEYLGRAGRNSPFAQARNRIRLMLEEGRDRVEKQTDPGSQTVH
jgi:putative two-component system response regulator